MHLLRFNMTAVHVPGKQLIMAATLSKSPLSQEAKAAKDQEVKAYIEAVITNKSITPAKLIKIRDTTQNNSDLQTVITCIRRGWMHRTAELYLHMHIMSPEITSLSQQD